MSEKLSDEEIQTYREVGKLVSEVSEKALEMVEPGKELIDIAEEVEESIRDKGAEPAFPCNISINEKAAHYSPPAEDETVIEEGDLVTIDLGAHMDGYIADMASTVLAEEESGTEEETEEEPEAGEEDESEPEEAEVVEEESELEEEEDETEEMENGEENEDVKKKKDMIEAINQVLEKAIEMIEPGVNIGEIGALIEETAEEHGYKPISNLTGHNLKRWSLHGGISIPNVEKEKERELEEGDVVALEPFITDGEGEVEDIKTEVYIFRCTDEGNVSGRMAQQTLRKIKGNYGKLPFAERWLTEDLSMIRLQVTLRDLLASEVLRPYYVLKEVEDGLVAQAEHTMIVTEDGCEVTTR